MCDRYPGTQSRESLIRSEVSPKYMSATPMTKPDKSSLLKVIVIYRCVSRVYALATNEINNNANYVKLKPPDGSIIASSRITAPSVDKRGEGARGER